MEIVSARNFRANQTTVLRKALRGESIMLSSRVGMFKIVPISEEDTITTRVCRGLNEVKQMREGSLKDYSVDEMLDEL